MKLGVKGMKEIGFQKSNLFLKKEDQVSQNLTKKKYVPIKGRSNIELKKDQFFRELTPYDVKEILQRIDPDHWKYFLSNSDAPSPMGMLVETVPVPPLCIRPTVKMTDEKKNEDDATIKIFEMIKQTESISMNIFENYFF